MIDEAHGLAGAPGSRREKAGLQLAERGERETPQHFSLNVSRRNQQPCRGSTKSGWSRGGREFSRSARTYIDVQNLPDCGVELFRVVVVDGDDVRPANVLLRVGMLGKNLGERNS